MKRRAPADLAASVRQRLKNIADAGGQDLQLLLTRYGVERLLYRLSRLEAGRALVLKGAALFYLWDGAASRPTRDVDFLGSGDPSPEALAKLFRAACGVRVAADGLVFASDTVVATVIRGRNAYGGIRVKLTGMLGTARIPLQVDIGFGDAVTPAPRLATFPALLDLPAPRVRAYPAETVVAEKFHAIVALGEANTRLKDFYDLAHLANSREFKGSLLAKAIRATFDRRGTPVPTTVPLALGDAFGRDPARQAQWVAFLSRSRLIDSPGSLLLLTGRVAQFVMPAAIAAAEESPFRQSWSPASGWRAVRARRT